MSDIEIFYPDPNALIPQVDISYCDTTGLVSRCLRLICPDSWLQGAEFPPSSHLLLSGPYGVGKTLLAQTLAAEVGQKLGQPVPLLIFDCSEDTREHNFMGSCLQGADGTTPFIAGPFPASIELANQCGCCVLCLEEINSLPPSAQKSVNRRLDWRKSLYVALTRTLHQLSNGARVIVIATMNPYGMGGTYTLNPDLRSRFDEVVMGFPRLEDERVILRTLYPQAPEELIIRSTQLAQDTRGSAQAQYKLSTRDLCKFLENTEKLGNIAEALLILRNKFEEEEQHLIDDRLKALFGGHIRFG